MFVPVWVLLERLNRLGYFPRCRCSPRYVARLVVLAGFMILTLFSSAVQHGMFFFVNWTAAGSVPLPPGGTGKLGVFIILTALLILPLLGRPVRAPALTACVLLASQVWCFASLLVASGGHALYRDDHPSMMFRLWEIVNTWPQLLNYVPYWSGGVVHYAGAASGLNGLGLLFWPILSLGEIHRVYTPILGITFIVLVPLLAVWSLRIMGGGWTAAWCAGVLALGVSRYSFKWMWHFGTVGANFATAFILPLSACVFRVLWLDRREWWVLWLMVIFFLFLVMWPPGAIMAGTLVLAAVVNVRRWTLPRIAFLATAGALALALSYRTIGLLYFEGGNEFFRHLFSRPGGAAESVAGSATAAGLADLRAGWEALRSRLQEVNPLIVFLGMFGALVLPGRSVRWWTLPTMLALAALCGWGSVLKPHLELDRMSIPLCFIAIAPAALAMERLLRTDHHRLAFVRAALVALLAVTGWTVAGQYRNRVDPTTTFLGERTQRLAAFIRDNTPPGSRALFAGKNVHFYGDHGHVALLPYLTGREMMACDYYHFSTHMIDYEHPPREFRTSPERIMEFMDYYNVSLVLTYHGYWIRRLRQWPQDYRELGSFDDMTAFQVIRKTPSSLFYMGSGNVKATFNRIDVETGNPEARTILKYNWREEMRVRPPVTIRPFPIGGGFNLIEIVWNGRTSCAIRFDSVW